MVNAYEGKGRDRRRSATTPCRVAGLALAALLALHVNSPAASRSWKDAVDGNWSDTNRWTPSGLPAAGEDVYITNSGAYTVTLATVPQYRSLVLGGDSGTQSVDWVTGVLPDGACLIAPHGVLNLVSNTGGWYLSGVLTNRGQVVWRSGSAGTWFWIPGARLENAPDGLLDVQTDGTIAMNSGAGSFHNLGTWRKSGGTGTTSLGGNLIFTNAGLVEVQQGAIALGSGLTSSGIFTVPSNAAVRLTGGAVHLLPGHAFVGDGYYGVGSGGSVTLDGPIAEPNFRMDGVTLTLSNQLTGTLQWSAGILAGAWSVAANGVLNLVSNTGSWHLSGALTNYGQVVWRSGSATAWIWMPDTRLENAPGALLDMQVDGTVSMFFGAGVFNNRGTWRKSGGAGTASFGPSFSITNENIVSAQSGVLSLPAGYAQTGGVYNVAIRNSNDYGRIAFAGTAPLHGRVEAALWGGFRPAPGTTFNVLGYPAADGMVDGFNGIDLDNGLRLDPASGPGGLSLTAANYPTNELDRLDISTRMGGYLFAWWPIALSGWGMEGTPTLTPPAWAPVPDAVLSNNVVLPLDATNRFFRIATPL